MAFNEREHHYTLYYYDQSGNLISTIPPEGVKLVTDANNLASIISDRKNKLTGANKTFNTAHEFNTVYEYNSLNQLVKQTTPDGGITHFWYDKLGRLVLSQNENQVNDNTFTEKPYSYTRYDEQNRIIEVGQVYSSVDFNTITNYSSLIGYLNPTSNNFPDNIAKLYSDPNISVYYKTEVTKTYYDQSITTINGFTQNNLRSRVAATTFQEINNDNTLIYNHATYYTYDVHGNVNSLLQDNPELVSYKDADGNTQR